MLTIEKCDTCKTKRMHTTKLEQNADGKWVQWSDCLTCGTGFCETHFRKRKGFTYEEEAGHAKRTEGTNEGRGNVQNPSLRQ